MPPRKPITPSKPTRRWFVYILRCRDGTLYTGITTDCTRRLQEHNAGTASRYTRSRRPVVLVYRECVTDQPAALRREAAIKKLPRSAKEQLITTGCPPQPKVRPTP
ncbi:MAG: GIY-YIG nuclease family protein [Gemmataceae bacterium]|nr:GIY-YIG nuclease family protein [Gemmata sp.]MDW8198064.1 GIY-YIG nuclease family protein [Gemmataceae bacterium]